jgi:phosphoribosylpyrophosphate synthetase
LYSVAENCRMGTSLTHYLRDKGLSVHYRELTDRFKNGDYNPSDPEFEGKPAYILAVMGPKSPSDVLHGRILATAKAARDNGASEVYVICPMELYGRAERGYSEDHSMRGKGNLVEMVAQTFACMGIDGYIVVDSHQPEASRDAFARYYKKHAFFNIDPAFFLYRYLLYTSIIDFSDSGNNVVFVIPDKGSVQRVNNLYELIKDNHPGVSWLRVDKKRLRDNDAEQVQIKFVGQSANFTTNLNKTVVWEDDIGETFGTISENNKLISTENEFTDSIGIPHKRVCYFTHPSFCMYHDNWDTQHMKSLERLVASGFDEIITTNTLDYFQYVLNVDRSGMDQALAIADELKQFTPEQRAMYYELQKKLTIMDITPTITKAMLYLENFDSLPADFDINAAFHDDVKGKRVAPYTYLRSHHFRDFKVRQEGNGDHVD